MPPPPPTLGSYPSTPACPLSPSQAWRGAGRRWEEGGGGGGDCGPGAQGASSPEAARRGGRDDALHHHAHRLRGARGC
eukprot:scaffold94699_cov36-Phaeocystis_antarctica.AAC.2